MLEISQLEFAYPKHEFRLHIERFIVDAGRQTALIGPSGSGKSTLLNLMAGIILPDQGRVVVDGCDLARLSRAARGELRITKIGLVFQSFELLEYLSVLDNLLLPFRLHGSLSLLPQVRERATRLADQLEIASKLMRYPSQLSHGERQRVAIGRALVTEPTLLLADEPTGNLDPTSKAKVLDLMLESASRQNVSVVMVTHDHGLLDRFETLYEVCSPKDGQNWSEIKRCGSGNDSLSHT
ncbi:MAG: ABC transporter ATP-binding protein [Planctomycetota bacterium]